MITRSFPGVAAAVLFLVVQPAGGDASASDWYWAYPLLLSKQADGGARIQWPEPYGAFDIVRGDLNLLRNSDGDFAIATESCLANDVSGSSFDDPDLPGVGTGFWYFVRWDQTFGFPQYGAQTYNEEGTHRGHQAADRNPGIAASTRDCSCFYFCCYLSPGQCLGGP